MYSRWLSSSTNGGRLSKGRALFVSNRHFFIKAHYHLVDVAAGCTQLGEIADSPYFNIVKIGYTFCTVILSSSYFNGTKCHCISVPITICID